MALIRSVSGIRGTIGGFCSENLTPLDIVLYSSAFAELLKIKTGVSKPKVVLGRDARISGQMLTQLVTGTLLGMGVDVIDLGLATTPTVEIAVPLENAQGGMILTASHNPMEWNALKLLNDKGEFISATWGEELLALAQKQDFQYSTVQDLGMCVQKDYLQKHVALILGLDFVQKDLIQSKRYKIVVDAVNSVGAIYVPALLEAFGAEVILINGEPNGIFAHNPEPLPEHLGEIMQAVRTHKADLGIVIDPDVDRLALVCEDGSFFGEEYTLVAVADYLLSKQKSDVVSNLSSSRALADIAHKHGVVYHASAVGEVHVVAKMKEVGAKIGGEGNGGIIYPAAHYGRDALVGIALFLSHLAEQNKTAKALRADYPDYFMAKEKITLQKVDEVLQKVQAHYAHEKINTTDGVRIDFEAKKSWVHLRKSNTEPIVRIYAESTSAELAQALAEDMKQVIAKFA